MSTPQHHRTVLLSIAVSLAMTASLLVGCGAEPAAVAPTVPSGPTALESLPKAQSALSTTAPDAKLLVIQTSEPVVATATAGWLYLFGSPSTGKTYAVTFDGTAASAEEYGSAALTDEQWAEVPGESAWKIDSDDALNKALEASGAKSAPNAYIMGIVAYLPPSDQSAGAAQVWNVQFDPGQSGATTKTIEVDAKTGVTSIAK